MLYSFISFDRFLLTRRNGVFLFSGLLFMVHPNYCRKIPHTTMCIKLIKLIRIRLSQTLTHIFMCYMSSNVNPDIEMETEVCLALARFYDSPPPSRHDGISEICDPKPEEHAKNGVPLWGESK